MIRYFGGLQGSLPPEGTAWKACRADGQWFLETEGPVGACYQDETLALLVRGICRFRTGARVDDMARFLAERYRQTGALPVQDLEGSFCVIVQDALQGRAILYRNLVGASFCYYTHTGQGFAFASNLAELAERRGDIAPNRAALPAYFLFRFVPGRDTLFRDCHRLLPGEEVVLDRRGVQRRQRQTFADLRVERGEAGSADRVDQVLGEILRDQAEAQPGTANLLSGGIDSTYLQARWGELTGRPTRSFSVCVNHPRCQPDTEYALTAAQALGAQHTLVEADSPYIDYLCETLSATGEPPNHAFAVYFGLLARRLAGAGVPAALCGEGADSLFGMGSTDIVRHATWLGRLAPLAGLRHGLARLAAWLGHDSFAAACRLADHLHDPCEWEHPLNRVAVFTDWDLAERAFGPAGIDSALAHRRSLLATCDVGDRLLDRMHAVGYLGEAADSAALWTTIFNQAGADLSCPFLDTRMLRLAVNLPHRQRFPYRRPKGLLKDALARRVPRAIVERGKLGFGQPVLEWLAPGGQLRPWVEQIGEYEWLPAAVRTAALARPGWFLYSLLCYDLWHKRFIDRTSIDFPAARRSRISPLPRVGSEEVLS